MNGGWEEKESRTPYPAHVRGASAPSKWLGLCDARDAGGRRLGSDPGYPIDSEIVMGPDSDK